MGMAKNYEGVEPRREEVDKLPGATVLEFGSPWCGYCRAAQPLIEQAFEGHDGVRHIKVADASGRRLGRSYKVKLWPTLIFLKDGVEAARLVRPGEARDIAEALGKIDLA
jgi:thioredoxin 1